MDAEGEEDCPLIRAIGPKSSLWEKFKIFRFDGYTFDIKEELLMLSRAGYR